VLIFKTFYYSRLAPQEKPKCPSMGQVGRFLESDELPSCLYHVKNVFMTIYAAFE